MDNTDSLQNIFVLLGLIGIIVVVIRSGLGAGIITTWSTTAMILRACVHVPWGLFLLFIGFSIILGWSGALGLLIGGWLVFTGGNYLFNSLAGFVGAPKSDAGGRATTASRASLRRRGLFGGR